MEVFTFLMQWGAPAFWIFIPLISSCLCMIKRSVDRWAIHQRSEEARGEACQEDDDVDTSDDDSNEDTEQGYADDHGVIHYPQYIYYDDEEILTCELGHAPEVSRAREAEFHRLIDLARDIAGEQMQNEMIQGGHGWSDSSSSDSD